MFRWKPHFLFKIKIESCHMQSSKSFKWHPQALILWDNFQRLGNISVITSFPNYEMDNLNFIYWTYRYLFNENFQQKCNVWLNQILKGSHKNSYAILNSNTSFDVLHYRFIIYVMFFIRCWLQIKKYPNNKKSNEKFFNIQLGEMWIGYLPFQENLLKIIV